VGNKELIAELSLELLVKHSRQACQKNYCQNLNCFYPDHKRHHAKRDQQCPVDYQLRRGSREIHLTVRRWSQLKVPLACSKGDFLIAISPFAVALYKLASNRIIMRIMNFSRMTERKARNPIDL